MLVVVRSYCTDDDCCCCCCCCFLFLGCCLLSVVTTILYAFSLFDQPTPWSFFIVLSQLQNRYDKKVYISICLYCEQVPISDDPVEIGTGLSTFLYTPGSKENALLLQRGTVQYRTAPSHLPVSVLYCGLKCGRTVPVQYCTCSVVPVRYCSTVQYCTVD